MPAGPVNSIEQAFEDEQIKSRGLVFDVEHGAYGSIKQVGSPVMTDGSNEATTPGPSLGQHTKEILIELLGCDSDEISNIRDSGALG